MRIQRLVKMSFLVAATLLCGGVATAGTEIGANEYIIFYHNDALGSPWAVTDHNGNTLWHEHSDPYGRARDRVMPTGKEFYSDRVGSRKGYTGHLKDEGTDLVYMKARFYDPTIGRFYSNDPVGFMESNPMMFNRYAYASNNPYRYVDPDGKNIKEAVIKGFSEAWEGLTGSGDGEFNGGAIGEALANGYNGDFWDKVGAAADDLNALLDVGTVAATGGVGVLAVGVKKELKRKIISNTLPGKNRSGDVERAASAARSQPYPREVRAHANLRMKTRDKKVTNEVVETAIMSGKGKHDIAAGKSVYDLPASQSPTGRGATVVTNRTGGVVTVIDKGSKFNP